MNAMARGKIIDSDVLAVFGNRWLNASRAERGAIVQDFASTVRMSPSTAYVKLSRFKRGIDIREIAAAKQTRKKRKHPQQIAIEKEHAKVIYAIKCMPGEGAKYGVSTEQCIRLAETSGQIPEGMYDRSKMDRLLREFGLSWKISQTRAAAYRLTAQYPGHVFVADATPMNHYYLRLDGQVKKILQLHLPDGDTHMDDILARENLYKIWVYFLVDMMSKTFVARAYAPEPRPGRKNGGENAEDWINFLTWAFLPKHDLAPLVGGRRSPLHDCPLEGAPKILFADKGSGIGNSSLVQGLCSRLDVRVETHLPGNPSAKGIIESTIGGFKRSYESFLSRDVVRSLDDVNHFYQAWTAEKCRRSGRYAKWHEGVVGHPVFRVTEQDIANAYVSHIERVIDGYGCVSIDTEQWFVTPEERYQKERVSLYSPLSRTGTKRWVAETKDKVLFECQKGAREHDFEDLKSFPHSEGRRLKDETRLVAANIRSALTYDDMLPPETDEEGNVRRFPARTRAVETHSAIAPDVFKTIEHARRWLLVQTGLLDDMIDPDDHETMQRGFDLALKTHGHIPGVMVIEFANILNKAQTEKRSETI